MDSAVSYYEAYLKKNGYTMSANLHSSRIANLIQNILDFTPPGGKILDIGCGDMALSKMLPQFNWTGVDINTEQSEGKAVKHNLESFPYPFAQGEFDTVVCSEVLEHMFNPMGITEEIKRILNPEGTYILSTPNFHFIDNYLEHFEMIRPDMSKPWTYEHIRHYSLESHMELLGRAGFEVIGFTGADAQYSKFFAQGRAVLQDALKALGKDDPNFTFTDQLMGRMFPIHSHTIMIVARPE